MNHIISERWKMHVTGEIQNALSGNSVEGIGRCRPLMVLDVEVDGAAEPESTCVGGLVGFGRGMRRWKMGGELGMELVRDGWEPLVQRYHWCFSTQPGVVLTLLSDHKGNTARSKARG